MRAGTGWVCAIVQHPAECRAGRRRLTLQLGPHQHSKTRLSIVFVLRRHAAVLGPRSRAHGSPCGQARTPVHAAGPRESLRRVGRAGGAHQHTGKKVAGSVLTQGPKTRLGRSEEWCRPTYKLSSALLQPRRSRVDTALRLRLPRPPRRRRAVACSLPGRGTRAKVVDEERLRREAPATESRRILLHQEPGRRECEGSEKALACLAPGPAAQELSLAGPVTWQTTSTCQSWPAQLPGEAAMPPSAALAWPVDTLPCHCADVVYMLGGGVGARVINQVFGARCCCRSTGARGCRQPLPTALPHQLTVRAIHCHWPQGASGDFRDPTVARLGTAGAACGRGACHVKGARAGAGGCRPTTNPKPGSQPAVI